MAAPGYFPLLVEGSWGPDPPKSLTTKLQLYFQSPKRSGGGECEVRPEPGSPARFLVLFHPHDGEGRRGGGARRPWGSPCGTPGLGRAADRLQQQQLGVGGLQNGPEMRGVAASLCPALLGTQRCCLCLEVAGGGRMAPGRTERRGEPGTRLILQGYTVRSCINTECANGRAASLALFVFCLLRKQF